MGAAEEFGEEASFNEVGFNAGQGLDLLSVFGEAVEEGLEFVAVRGAGGAEFFVVLGGEGHAEVVDVGGHEEESGLDGSDFGNEGFKEEFHPGDDVENVALVMQGEERHVAGDVGEERFGIGSDGFHHFGEGGVVVEAKEELGVPEGIQLERELLLRHYLFRTV